MNCKNLHLAIMYSSIFAVSACASDDDKPPSEDVDMEASSGPSTGPTETGPSSSGPSDTGSDPGDTTGDAGEPPTSDSSSPDATSEGPETGDDSGGTAGDPTSSDTESSSGGGTGTTGGTDSGSGTADTDGSGGVSTACDGNPLDAPIPSGGMHTWTFDFDEVGTTQDAGVGLDLATDDTGALRLTLSHDGTTVTVIDGQCAGDPGLEVEFADGADPLDCSDLLSAAEAAPTQPFSSFAGSPSEGAWTLTAENVGPSDLTLDVTTACVTVFR
jgi:hypothetical protein